MNNNAPTIAKSNANYTCIECGATEFISAHHEVPGDDSTLVCLCAECHSRRHPDVPRLLFFSKTSQPYWSNKSASTLAKANNVHTRTIIRIAKRLNIPKGTLTDTDETLIIEAMASRWTNISGRELADRIGICYQTIINRAKSYDIPFHQSISQQDIEQLKLSPRQHRKNNKPKPPVKRKITRNKKRPTQAIRIWRCTADECGHIWAGRKNTIPHICPNCHKYLYIEEIVPNDNREQVITART